MVTPSPSPAVLRDEIQSTNQHIDLRNEVQQVCANEVQNVQTDLQKLRAELLPDLKRLINRSRGSIMPLEIVPFANGDDPTQPPHNLPPLVSVDVIETLNEKQVISYLSGYGIKPLPTGPNTRATEDLWRNYIITLIGAAKL